MVQGIVIICHPDGRVNQVLYNGYVGILALQEGDSLLTLCNESELEKANKFLKAVSGEGGIFNWEINIDFPDHIKPLKFSGGKSNGGFIIFGLETNQDVPFLFEELAKINNEQNNHIRRLVKEFTAQQNPDVDDRDAFNELTKLNNEMATLQRELSRKNHELVKLNDLKNKFLGMAAHDLRNPLGNITFYVDFIEEESNLTEEQKDYLLQIKTLSSFMLNLVNDLLDISAIEGGRIQLRSKPVDLVRIIDDVLRLNRNLAERKEIGLDFKTALKNAKLNADPGKLEQVLINLISNAVKYSHSGTEIEITLAEKKEHFYVSVRDQGQGIDKEELDLLFKPFQRTSTQSTGGEQSTGLGLFIVKNIVEAHHGKIWAESQPGKGSTFNFSLPKNL